MSDKHSDWDKKSPEEKERQRMINNPHQKQTGHYTGRCKECGSDDLWDDMAAYGCNSCKAIYFTG